ncbi:MAG: response regulator [Eubacterium sp.]|nr:response regulator [Eubacterium sp.]
MERVTENYLEGEQRICDVWARYINNTNMTMEEAAAYIRTSHVLSNTSAHLVFLDTRTGLSTRAKQGTTDDYAVSYSRVDILNNMNLDDEIGKSINITRAYTNPMNGEQSLAFCNTITLFDQENKTSKDAILMRIIPISELEQKWVFPQTEFANAELSMIDSNGDYILKGSSFKNSNFFEFYNSYNTTDPGSSKQLAERITTSTGSISMLNSHNRESILAYAPVDATSGWAMLGFVPAEDLHVDKENWLLIGAVSAGLLILFLIDILSNAIKYTEPGGRIGVDLREEKSSVPDCVRLVYVVADTGIGMSEEFIETMYQPFSRQIDSRVNSVQGTGLGLAITKQMVELVGGSIECQSEQGKGTTFTVVLDIPAAEKQLEDMRLDPVDILIVDDDEIMLETAVDSLESLGATTDRTQSGTAALDMIEKKHLSGKDYDIVIVDWKMPEIDGLETIRRIRSRVDADIPILLISAYDWSDIEEKAK